MARVTAGKGNQPEHRMIRGKRHTLVSTSNNKALMQKEKLMWGGSVLQLPKRSRWYPAYKMKMDIVQVKNPKTNRYVKIDRSMGVIISHKRTSGAYKGIPVIAKAVS